MMAETNAEQRAELRRLAEAAQAAWPGQWFVGMAPDGDESGRASWDVTDGTICTIIGDGPFDQSTHQVAEICTGFTPAAMKPDEANAYIVAAQPAAMLAVLRDLEAAEARADLLDGFVYDDGDMNATGEYVVRRFQEVRGERDRLAALLRDLEWSGAVLGARRRCPSCACDPQHGHAVGCRLAAALREQP